MHASQARRLDQYLDVTCNPIPGVVGASGGLRGDLEHFVDARLVDADRPGEGGETCVRSIAGLVDDVDVKVVHLVVEQCLGFHLRLGGVQEGGIRTAEKAQNLEASTRSTASAASWAAAGLYVTTE